MLKKYILTQLELTAHKFWVAYFMFKVAARIIIRGMKHDLSKYSNAEAIHFARTHGDLGKTEYSTDEYDKLKQAVKPALDHHYRYNRHHPEHFEDGFKGMSALDRIEMACDITAACKRTKNGDVRFSIEKNQERFDYSDDDKKWISSLVDELERRQDPRRKLS